MKIQYVNIEHVHTVWDYVAPFLQMSGESGGTNEYTLDQIKVRITDGAWHLLVAVDDESKIVGASAVYFFNRPNDRVGYIVKMGGKLITGPEEFDQLKKYMKAHGATCVEASVRESVARLLNRHGFKEKYRVVGAKI